MTEEALPSGTVTFLMSDIEGSTRLLQEVGDAYVGILGDHYSILSSACAAMGGVTVSTEGDSMFFVFSDAASAIAAAARAQQALAEHRWPGKTTVRVRMGIHSGEGRVLGSTYVGLDVHRVARIAAAAHGGQILVSDSTRALGQGRLERDHLLKDLGQHGLKDLDTPEHLFQLAAPGLASDFAPLRSAPVARDRLPPELTSFVGRVRERDQVAALLRSSRIVTLTGPGGTGKTRLSVAVGGLVALQFVDGVHFVALASISELELFAATVARALGLKDGGRPTMDALREHLRDRSMLVVLDNFEQVMAAAPILVQLAAGAPGVQWLVTSREPLRVPGEQTYPVPPLAVPTLASDTDVAEIREIEAVALFTQRARLVRHNFDLTVENASAVAEICVRLDGLPLAIELAAARISLFEPAEINARLDQRLSFLAGSRDADARQRSLRGAIDWSHELLGPAEQTLFRRVAVFTGGCTLEAAEAICRPTEFGADIVDGISSLHDKSLLRREESVGNELRLTMLETIHEYGLERLVEAGETDDLRRRHFEYYLAMAERAASRVNGPHQQQVLDALSRDLDNVRAALRWAIDNGQIDPGLRLMAALSTFWIFRDHAREGRNFVAALLDAPESISPATRAALLGLAADLATWQADYNVAIQLAEQSLDLYRELADHPGIADQLTNLGWGLATSDPVRARSLFAEAIERYRALGMPPKAGQSLTGLAVLEMQARDLAAARRHLGEADALFRDGGDGNMAVIAAGLRAICLRLAGDLTSARREYLHVLERAEAIGAAVAVTLPLQCLADLALLQGDAERAAAIDAAQARLGERIGGTPGFALMGIPSVADRARAELGDERYDAAAARGRSLSFEDMTRLARA